MATPKFKARVRAALACQIVNLDRVKFNDAVASRTYPCAPITDRGSARIFDEEALLPLYFFARLTEFGIPAGRAGQLACDMAIVARADYSEPADRIIFVQGTSSIVFIPSRIRTKSGQVKNNYNLRTQCPDVGRVIFTIEFNVKSVREIITEAFDRHSTSYDRGAARAAGGGTCRMSAT